jgi:two-component sensor histidine kinase
MSIRVRLGLAMAVALFPVLLLGASLSVIAFNKETRDRRADLSSAAERSAESARARLQSATVLLETISPATVGVQCTSRLRQLMSSNDGFANLVRLDAAGRVRCAADTVLGGRERREQTWFKRLEAGEEVVVESAPAGRYAAQPAVLAAARATDDFGRFDGALMAVIKLPSLRPTLDRGMPADTQVALINADGRYISQTDPGAFIQPPAGWAQRALKDKGYLFYGRDEKGQRRVFSVAPLLEDDVFTLLSAPSPGAFSWLRINILSSVLFPLIAFLLALGAVWIVTENVVVRWLKYVERIAAIYAKGRFTVRPVRADRAPPEIRDLARTLDALAETIVTRDLSLRDSLAQKDGLMREIHHRVKNNLQVITSLLNMQQRALTDPGARAAMTDTRQRISALALIYRALYQGPDLKKVDLRHFLEELIAQIVTSEHEPGVAVRTELDADELIIDPDKLAPLALFAVEAITNAQKHAFAGRGGTLRVRFKVDGDEARLEIADDGATAAADRSEEGVGRTLMTAFARQLRGRSEFNDNLWGGVTVSLIFPTPEGQGKQQAGQPGPKGNRAAA